MFHGFGGTVLLVIRDAEFAARIAGVGVLRDHLLQVGDLRFGMTLPALHQRQVVEGASIVRLEGERLFQTVRGLRRISPTQ